MGEARPLVVIGAGSFWSGTRLADRHVAEFLSKRADVLYVDPPMSFRTARNDPRLADAAREKAFRPVAPGIWRLIPKVPPRDRYRLIRPLTSWLVTRAVRRAVESMDRPVSAVLSTSDRVLGVVDGRQVFWARDDYSAGGGLMGLAASQLRAKEIAAARKADLVVAVTPSLVDKWTRLGVSSVLVPNGVDADLFATPGPRPTDMPTDRPVVGFCGTLSARIDLSILHRIVDAGLCLVLIGHPQWTMDQGEIDRLADRPGVAMLGHRSYDQLPAYMAAMDVGLVPYTDSAFNRASFPLKTLEYLAAGLPVVATDLPAIRSLDTDLVTIADPDQFVTATVAAVALRDDRDLLRRRQAFAARHDWAARVEEIAVALGIDHGAPR